VGAAAALSLTASAVGGASLWMASGPAARAAQQTPAPQAAAAAGVKRALIVAISDYAPKGPGGSDLVGCDKDAERMEKLLTEKFGFRAANITQLLDTQATRAAIEDAITRLGDASGPNDSVVLYYSGHGAQVPDLDGDEDDGWDEALVGADPVGEGAQTTETRLARYVTDDKIAELLRRFKTSNVTVIFDSCHSGTAVRDAGAELPPPAQVKRVTPDFSQELLKQAQDARQTKQADTRDDTLDIGDRYVFIAGCQPYELSGCVPKGGFLTMAIDLAVRSLPDGVSWAQMAQPIREAVNEINATQTPSFEGAVRRKPFALAEVRENARFVRPSLGVAGSAAVTRAGSAALAEKVTSGQAGTHRALLDSIPSLFQEQGGALYDVYPATDKTFSGAPKGRVRVTGTMERIAVKRLSNTSEEQFATADIVSGGAAAGDRLVAVSVPVPQATPRVAVLAGKADADKAAARTLFEALKKDPAFAVVESAEAPVDYLVQASGGGHTVFGRGGWMIARFATDAPLRGFILGRHQQATRLARLHNPGPAYALQTAVAGGDRVRRPGDTVGFEASAAREGYFYVLTATQNGELRVRAATSKPVPVGNGIRFDLVVPEPYEGRMMVKVLHTVKPLDAAAIQGVPAAQRMDALFKALQKEVTTGGPGTEASALSTNDWADATLLIPVRNPNPG